MGLPHNAYNIDMEEPINTETMSGEKYTIYNVNLTDKQNLLNLATFGVREWERDNRIATEKELTDAMSVQLGDAVKYRNPEVATRTIDGTIGVVGSADLRLGLVGYHRAYLAQYQPVFNAKHLFVNIFITYPWNEGTSQFLKTIHVEKVK